jgi:hypothetical protein
MNATTREPATLKRTSMAIRMPVIQMALRIPNVSTFGSMPNSGFRIVEHS